MDQDTAAVIGQLSAALRTSGLNQTQFARALGTSPSRFSTYMTGNTSPSAAFLMRAVRLAGALAAARERKSPTALSFATAIRGALRDGDEHWALTLCLEARDRLRDTLARHPDLGSAWEAEPRIGDDRWDTLLGALVSHEFESCESPAPAWATARRLGQTWTIGEGYRDRGQIAAHTPAWLAERGIEAHERDLSTV